MKRLSIVILLGSVLLAGCELLNQPPPEPPPPDYDESCADGNADLENSEASAEEILLGCLIRNHDDQARPQMIYDPILGSVARARTDAMTTLGYFDNHIDPDGFGPNYWVLEAGYALPDGYSDADNANNVESAGWGSPSLAAQTIFNLWLNSPSHKSHVLAEVDFYAGQVRYGIGHARANPSVDDPPRPADYWVFIAAHPPEASLGSTEPPPAP